MPFCTLPSSIPSCHFCISDHFLKYFVLCVSHFYSIGTFLFCHVSNICGSRKFVLFSFLHRIFPKGNPWAISVLNFCLHDLLSQDLINISLPSKSSIIVIIFKNCLGYLYTVYVFDTFQSNVYAFLIVSIYIYLYLG